MTRASFEPAAAPPASRIISAEALGGVRPVDLSELSGARPAPARPLSARDLNNETARAAYALGHRRGYEQGARAGLAQGYSEGSQALEAFQSRKAADVAAQMQRMLDGFGRDLAALESQVASDLVSLAVDIARQVLRRELSTDPQALLPAAREALRALGEGASSLELRMHPEDAARIAPHLDAVQSGTCRIAEDPQLPRGSCQVEGDTGIADAGFEARWHAVMARLGRDEEPLP
ncbi:MAG TPA: flagellar assembly protein FliH [Ramlibacter sp.]|uniref:flagellar assembly protein FliH n=1 Tax=Ramlibacter sp. TaxID=1917967 RepID=UPI002D60DAFA|nr:flagellar assembly protein FliH [Ramlibacter sp.]HZY19157.1 flagellar assembly protein FliH [Ramlibacter sp.]